MLYFNNDYSEGCHPRLLERLAQTNLEQTPGYGTDRYCAQAAERLRKLCGREDVAVHFLVGGTQANLTVIAAALRPHQAVIAAATAHIHCHETGAVEATGHKVLAAPSDDGKLTAGQVAQIAAAHAADPDREHTAQPKMVYISQSTELGTLYTRRELEELSQVCRRYGLYLFVDGARLAYALAARDNDVTLADLARLCDVFYLGGTKAGALFGEAVVVTNPVLAADFRYAVKQRGGMLAKGRLLGVQFDALLADGLIFTIAARANALADQIRDTLARLSYPLRIPGTTNQVFAILPEAVLAVLRPEFAFTEQERVGDDRRVVRICTSWATRPEAVDALCRALTAAGGICGEETQSQEAKL